jgi:CRISPR-associated protein Cas2
MVVIVTSDVPNRFRGFLASVMLEIAPAVYTSPGMTTGVRERVWSVLEEWFHELGGGSIVMTWLDNTLPSRQGLRTLGLPAREFVDLDGIFTTRTESQGCSTSTSASDS